MAETYTGNLTKAYISPEVLNMADKSLIESRFVMPVGFREGELTLVTSKYLENILDEKIVLNIIRKTHPEVEKLHFLEVAYDVLRIGYNVHYKMQLRPAIATTVEADHAGETVTTEQTKLSETIIQRAITLGASDIHITPVRDGSIVQYRVDGKLRNSGITLTLDDEFMINNIYKRNANLEVVNLIPQDGRFSFGGKNIRLSTMPYGGGGVRNKIVLRILSSSDDSVAAIEDLGFNEGECSHLRDIMYKPSGIFLVCGPTGEGKTTTQYAMLNELNQSNEYVIVTFEDPIERYIDGIAQSQVRDAEDERMRYTFLRGLRSALRQDPNIILIGEIRDMETAQVAVQSSQTGHLIFSTLHVRNSISVFRRLEDIGANVSGFAEQIVGIASQRLLSLNCPHCRQPVVSPLNRKLRKCDLALLENGEVTYESGGCSHCGGTGIAGRIPIIEILTFDNFLRDYFSEKHGLIDIEKTLRSHYGFQSLWDKGLKCVSDGRVSLKELLSRIEPDDDIIEESSGLIYPESFYRDDYLVKETREKFNDGGDGV